MLLVHLVATAIASPALASLWTRPAPVRALAVRGSTLAAATEGGLVFWDLDTGRTTLHTTWDGLPGNAVRDVAFADLGDALCVATPAGFARRTASGCWETAAASPAPAGACIARAGNGWIVARDDGWLIAWARDRLDSLAAPGRGRVVGLAYAPAILDAGASRPSTQDRNGTAADAPFALGLAIAREGDGLHVLRANGSWTRWLAIGPHDGLPGRRPADIVAGANGILWVATDAGLAAIAAGPVVHAWPGHPLLGAPIATLAAARDGSVLAGSPTGLVRVRFQDGEISAASVAGVPGPVVALACSGSDLWWSDGDRIASLDGRVLELPRTVARNASLSLHVQEGKLWVGHDAGFLSVWDDRAWERVESTGMSADVRSLLLVQDRLHAGTDGGLFVQECLGTQARFVQVDGVPPGSVLAQVLRGGVHWIGGEIGLWRRDLGGWQRVDLWPGASAVQGLAAAAETLWATAGTAGVGRLDGSTWKELPLEADLLDARCGRLLHAPGRPLLVATDRGVAAWDGARLRRLAGAPGQAAASLAWWDEHLACGTDAGLALRDPNGSWFALGSADGLPAAALEDLAVTDRGELAGATSEGVLVLPRVWVAAPGRTTDAAALMDPRSRGSAWICRDARACLPAGTAVDVYDVRGRRVFRGRRADVFRRPAPGVYFVRWRSSGRTQVRRILPISSGP